MDILFLSVLSSRRLIKALHRASGRDLGFAIQKFNRLFVEGLKQNGAEVEILSALPISRQVSRKILWNISSEKEDDLIYHYLPFINYTVLRQLILFISTLLKVFIWSLGSREKVVVCDVLNISICLPALLVCKVRHCQIVGFVTDMPGLMVGNDSVLSTFIRKSYISSFSKYIFLTEAANAVINIHHKPYIVMEGISDPNMANHKKIMQHSYPRRIMYAGGLFTKYGVETLVKAVSKLEPEKAELVLYGSGPFVEELVNYYCKKFPNIKYLGVLLNSDIIKAELDASLLVNPRLTDEEFTKYSFPSKNIEYMASGTPLVTTRLPGMPEEYFSYVFLMDDESVDGYANTLRKVLSLSDEELYAFGDKAKNFILENKNAKRQGERIINLLLN